MALISVPTASSGSSRKVISIGLSGQGSSVVYTVSANKTFTGFIGFNSYTYVYINGSSVYGGVNTSGCGLPYEVVLPGGTTFAPGNTTGILLGYEA